MRGTRSIYVDYVDYDEIAHHAGATRVESLASLDGLDHVLAILEKVAARAPRRYHFVAAERPRTVAGRAVRGALRHRAQRPVRRASPSPTRRGSRAASRAGAGSTRCWRTWPGRRRLGRPAGRQPPGGEEDRPAGAGGRRRPDRPGQRQPRPGLRRRARSGSCSRRSRRAGRPSCPGLVDAPGRRLRQRALRGRPGGHRPIGAAPPGHRGGRGRRPAAAVRRPRAGDGAARDLGAASARSSTSTAPSTPAPSTSPPSSRWSAATVAWVAGRTAASCWPHPPARPHGADRGRRRAPPAPGRDPGAARAPDDPAEEQRMTSHARRGC